MTTESLTAITPMDAWARASVPLYNPAFLDTPKPAALSAVPAVEVQSREIAKANIQAAFTL